MEKPTTKQARPYYNLFEVLNYVDKEVQGFRKKVWKDLCNMGYINNDTSTGIYWEGLIGENTSEEVIEGIEYMFKEFPDIKEGTVDFWISW